MKAYVVYEDALEITTRAELDALIARVRGTETPTIIGLESASATLSFGVGGAGGESWVGYATADEAFHSVGNLERQDMLVFLHQREMDEFYGEMAIPEALAIEAAHAFLANGERPAGITWESDW